jgi:hypothetical protein
MGVLPALAARLPGTTFVVRSHPGESDHIWQRLAARIPNLKVSRAHPLDACLRAARATIYMAGCTTGLEAMLAHVRAIRFVAAPDLEFPAYGLSAHINPAAGDVESLAALIESDVRSPESAAADQAFVGDCLDIDGPPSALRMAEGLAALWERFRDPAAKSIADLVPTVAEAIRRSQDALQRSAGTSLSFRTLMADKRVPLDAAEIESLIAGFRRSFGRPFKVAVTRISPEAVIITPA